MDTREANACHPRKEYKLHPEYVAYPARIREPTVGLRKPSMGQGERSQNCPLVFRGIQLWCVRFCGTAYRCRHGFAGQNRPVLELKNSPYFQ